MPPPDSQIALLAAAIKTAEQLRNESRRVRADAKSVNGQSANLWEESKTGTPEADDALRIASLHREVFNCGAGRAVCTDVEGLRHVNLTGVLTRAGTNGLDACTLARRAGLLSTVLHLENSLTAWTGPAIIIEANHPKTLAPSVVICREDQMPHVREFCRQLKQINVWVTPWSPENLYLAQEWALEHSN